MNTKSSTIFLALLIFLVPMNVSLGAADDSLEEMSTREHLYVRGLISKIYPERMQISVRPAKGDLVRVSIDADTVLEGISRIDEFEKEQQVKIWYKPENEKNRAIKIVKMMELGC